MTTNDVLKEEEITLTYETWTFDPSAVTQLPDDEEGILRFSEEVEEVFREEGYAIFARNMELFELTELDGKTAYVLDKVQPIAIIVDSFEEDAYFDDEESVDYNIVLPGRKVLFVADGVLLFPGEDGGCLLRHPQSAD